MNNSEELIKTTKKLFSLNLIVVLYIALTILSTADSQLILNGAVRLPIFNVEIQLTYFLILGSVTPLILFMYFLIHFDKVLKSPDTNSKFSWLILEAHIPTNIKNNDGIMLFNFITINNLERIIGYFSIWGILPITNLLILYKTIYTHDILLIIIISTFIFSINLLLFGYYNIIHQSRKTADWKLPTIVVIIIIVVTYGAYQLFLKSVFIEINIGIEKIFLFLFLIGFLVLIISSSKYGRDRSRILRGIWLFVLFTPVLAGIHYSLIAKVGEMKNVNLSGQILNDKIGVSQGYFNNIDLRGAKLDAANLIGATLKNAILKGADLQKTALSYANLDGSDFENVKLHDAILRGTSLLDVKNLTYEQLKSVSTLWKAKFDSSMESTIIRLKENKPDLFKMPPN